MEEGSVELILNLNVGLSMDEIVSLTNYQQHIPYRHSDYTAAQRKIYRAIVKAVAKRAVQIESNNNSEKG